MSTLLARTIMRASRIVFPLLLALAPATADAQRTEVLRLPGRIIEVTGLERWTIQMLQDSLGVYSPGDSLQSHACAAVLRYKLHFAEASSTTLLGSGGPADSVRYTLVQVVEPQDSGRVHHIGGPIDTLSRMPEWAGAVEILRRGPNAVNLAWPLYLAEQRGGTGWSFPRVLAEDTIDIRAMQRWLLAHRTPRDQELAQRVLAESPSMFDQVVAIAILSTLPPTDSTWSALLHAMRAENGWAPGMATTAFAGLLRSGARPTSWIPLAPDIHALLDGTGLFNLSAFSWALAQAGVDSSLARPFLAGGGHALVALAQTSRASANAGARALLRALFGRDPGTDPAEWRRWIAALEPHP